MTVVPLPTLASMLLLSSLVALLIAPLFHETPNRKDWLAFPFGIAGGFLIAESSFDILTIGWILLAVNIVLLAVSINLFATQKDSESSLWATFILMATGVPLLIFQPEVFSLGLNKLLALAGSGIALGLGNYYLHKSFQIVPAFRAILIKPLSACITAALAIVLLNAPWTVETVVGFLLITLSTWVVYWAQKESETNPKTRSV